MPMILLLPAILASGDPQCMRRQQFFEEKSDGSLAIIHGVHDVIAAAHKYSGWCPIETDIVREPESDRVFFGLNNRSDSAGQPRYYIVKAFRHSRATELRPLLSLRRVGNWKNAACAGSAPSDGAYLYNASGPSVIQDFISKAHDYTPAVTANGCEPIRAWFASAFGVASLSTADQARFLAYIPEHVARTGLNNWSLSVTAFSYGTVADTDRLADFPRLVVNRNGADEIIVQYVSSGSKYHEFLLAK